MPANSAKAQEIVTQTAIGIGLLDDMGNRLIVRARMGKRYQKGEP
jgi:hypothetical protein